MLTSKKNELENIKLIIFDLDGTLYKLNAKNFWDH